MASQVANKRYVENIKMKKKFGHGYKGSEERTLSLGILGAMGEVAYCKAKNVFFNGSYSDIYNRYDKADVGNDIEITREGTKLKLYCKGDFANQETEIECTEESPVMSGIYSLRYMNIFTKATSMCSTVQIMQEEQNRFLILKYNVANLGELKFYLATKVSEDL